MQRSINKITGHSRIDGLIPGIKGQRAFPIRENRGTDPFIMLDHIGSQEVGVDYFLDGSNHGHPHRGFETITFMFEGTMFHKDSLGNKLTLSSGGVQRMNAGYGIQHGGDMASDKVTGVFHEVQLWVNLPSKLKMSKPEVQNLATNQIPVIDHGHYQLRLISGNLEGHEGPAKTNVPTKIAHVISGNRASFSLNGFDKNENVMVYILKGDITASDQNIEQHNTVNYNFDGTAISFEMNAGTELLIMAGQPINEPVVMGGPFVMNTEEEIEQAYQDFRDGKFGIL
ncbi:MAG: redox-sensitive bicupin YhaK (pirin superfamily) [Crocinitomix sp.]|jgi:redox-sensitive bicupin YhaK (pirin superfamily)